MSANGTNLIQFSLSASDDAQGKFDIVVVADPINGSAWYADGSFTAIALRWPPFGSTISVGSVTVSSVPEPATAWQLRGWGLCQRSALVWRRGRINMALRRPRGRWNALPRVTITCCPHGSGRS